MEIEILEKPEEHNFGSNRMNPDYQACKITVLNPEKIPEDWVGVRDMEVTIVHEILHVRVLYAFGVKKANCHVEMCIETIAKALVANKRGITPEDLK